MDLGIYDHRSVLLVSQSCCTNYHKLDGLNQRKFIPSEFQGPKVRNQRISKAALPPEMLEENQFLNLLHCSSFRHFGLWSHYSSLCRYGLIGSSSDCDFFCMSFIMTLIIRFGPNHRIQNDFLISKSLTFKSAKGLFPSKVMFTSSRDQDLDMSFGGPQFSPLQLLISKTGKSEASLLLEVNTTLPKNKNKTKP